MTEDLSARMSTSPPVPAPGETREQRLAEALRANLARRKAQQRARAASGGPPEPPGEPQA